mmetsp:Transcript_17278/g.19991  ORF Transcript_17278/g.19991 Transcript_17278/m.19991 type:complete len:354 (+) Transcript_17278:164-1225(+)
MTSKHYSRSAYHAGSWYEDESPQLNLTLQNFLDDATVTVTSQLTTTHETQHGGTRMGIPRGIISPHAGYSYSGPTAAYAYMHLREALERGFKGTVLVLHPSHHVHIDGCAISGASMIETPLHNIPVDNSLRLELLQTKQFSTMSKQVDEREHSGEMQYPYIAKIYTDYIQQQRSSNSNKSSSSSSHSEATLQILPIMVGSTSTSQESFFGKILAPILSRDNIFTIISTDFCHWGSRFGYTPTSTNSNEFNQSRREIHEYIEWLDNLGMDQITLKEPGAFAKYMKTYKNTICGRHPIGVYLHALKENSNQHSKQQHANKKEHVNLCFVKYAQSSQVKRMGESSVSYASAVARKV